MLKVSVSYAREGMRDVVPLVESVDPQTVKRTTERILSEYAQGIATCQDEVLATLIGGEIRKAINVLRAAGIELEDENNG